MQQKDAKVDFAVAPEDVAAFQRDGFLVVRSLLSQEEISLIRTALAEDPAIRSNGVNREDDSGAVTRSVVWLEPGDSTYGRVARLPRVVDTMAACLGDEVYHYQAKLNAKEPFEGGSWEWHQDYGYWYEQNCHYPDMGTMMLALDPSTKENGCLQVLAGSHRMGTVRHVFTEGGQRCADPERVGEIMKVLDLVYCELEPGDALFFHCNLLHRSDRNRSDMRRWMLLDCYNTRHNSPFKVVVPGTPYRPIKKIPDDGILTAGLRFATGEERFQSTYVEKQKKAAGVT